MSPSKPSHPLRLALVGYGKMGKAVEADATARGHEITATIDGEDNEAWRGISPETTDAVIEFTRPDVFMAQLDRLLGLGVPIVTGTTGWYDRIEEVRERVTQRDASLLYASNFSVGVNILFQLNKHLARLMNDHPAYDPFVEERHHRHKADGPSGTAHSLAQQILGGVARKQDLADAALRQRAPKAEELSVGFVRAGEIFGTHRVAYTSEIDTITISHEAHSRRGFARGAVLAAEWVQGKRGLITFESFFEK